MKTKLPTEWQELIDQLGFQEFTPIQTQLFEPITEGENLLGVSPTGTGKTLAYLLPSLLKLQKKKAQGILCLCGREFNSCRHLCGGGVDEAGPHRIRIHKSVYRSEPHGENKGVPDRGGFVATNPGHTSVRSRTGAGTKSGSCGTSCHSPTATGSRPKPLTSAGTSFTCANIHAGAWCR